VRTTVDLPSALHRRVLEIARQTDRSLSAVVADLVIRGLSQLDGSMAVGTDERSGFPVISVGRRVTSAGVASALDES
jgi:predicted transcriptional regulator